MNGAGRRWHLSGALSEQTTSRSSALITRSSARTGVALGVAHRSIMAVFTGAPVPESTGKPPDYLPVSGLSRRRSRVRVPSLPFQKRLQIESFLGDLGSLRRVVRGPGNSPGQQSRATVRLFFRRQFPDVAGVHAGGSGVATPGLEWWRGKPCLLGLLGGGSSCAVALGAQPEEP